MTMIEAQQMAQQLGQQRNREYAKVVAEPLDPANPRGAWHVVGEPMADSLARVVLAR